LNTDKVYHTIFLMLGSNLSDRISMLEAAKATIRKAGISITKESHLYETAAWGKTDQPPFINQVIQISCNLIPLELLARILDVEKELGRKRLEIWGPRCIDIDILYFNQQICIYDNLKIPHPEIQNRRFALAPLVEIASDFIHPVFNLSNATLLERCIDNLDVKKLDS